MSVELWLRPWARYAAARRQPLTVGQEWLAPNPDGPLLLQFARRSGPRVDGQEGVVELFAHLPPAGHPGRQSEASNVWELPLPANRRRHCAIEVTGGHFHLLWPRELQRIPPGADSKDDPERRACELMLRAEAVWDRVGDVEDALADPMQLWATLHQRWMTPTDQEPRMDVIVQHEQEISHVLDELERRPRRILRRVHRAQPVGRVQEIDRRSMLWLARQPGKTLAERAGDDQRVLSVARQENLDTLENRVLRAYCELAHRHAREYLDRNRTRKHTHRAQRVEKYGKRCARLARELASWGVRRAEAGVPPNFVLQQNFLYHRVWVAWRELIERERRKDDLWRWQARSWDEFCMLAVLVALNSIDSAQRVVNSPLWFRDEHRRGRWIETDEPVMAVHYPASNVVAELKRQPAPGLEGLGASLWLHIDKVGARQPQKQLVAIWPLWSAMGGLVPGEASEVGKAIKQAAGDAVPGGLVLRPALSDDIAELDAAGSILTLTVGTEGKALTEALWAIASFLEDLIAEAGS